MKRQPIEWEKIFTNNETDKRFVSKTYKQLMILNSMKTVQSNNRQKITNGKELIELLMKVGYNKISVSLISKALHLKT